VTSKAITSRALFIFVPPRINKDEKEINGDGLTLAPNSVYIGDQVGPTIRSARSSNSAKAVDIKECTAPMSISSSNSPSDLRHLHLARIARVLAEPQRMRILRDIGANEESQIPCDSLCALLNIGRPTLSHHIKQLESAGLLVLSRRGKFVGLTLNRKALRAYATSLMEI
jgi:ArsR family transcriptional regulator, arsenate/arsenite/antimonite-responsive transcriptional repressor